MCTVLCVGSVAAVLCGAAPVLAEPPVTSRRLAGPDRYATALAIANDTFPGSAEGETHAAYVAVARGDDFADALAAVTAVPQDGAVLLTPRDDVPAGVARFVADRNNGLTYLTGQQDVVGAGVEQELEDLRDGDQVLRLGGRDRYETAAAAHRSGGDFFGGGTTLDGLRTAVLVNGLNPADAVSAGPMAYKQVFPLLLTAPDRLPQATLDALLLDDDGHARSSRSSSSAGRRRCPRRSSNGSNRPAWSSAGSPGRPARTPRSACGSSARLSSAGSWVMSTSPVATIPSTRSRAPRTPPGTTPRSCSPSAATSSARRTGSSCGPASASRATS